MKKWMVIAIAMVLAGCGDVSVEGEADVEGENSDSCHNLVKECRVDGSGQYKLYVICKDNENIDVDTIKSEPLCECEEGKDECKSESTEPKEQLTCPDECQEGFHCDLNSKECVECLDDSHCDGGQCINYICTSIPEDNIECNNNDDCETNEICVNNKCLDNPCLNSTIQCNETKTGIDIICDELTKSVDICDGVCYQETADDIPRCVDCVEGDEETKCNQATEVCKEFKCVAKGECVTNDECYEKEKPICGDDNKCRKCSSDEECGGLFCHQDGACVECIDNSNCTNADEICDDNGKCVEKKKCDSVCDENNKKLTIRCTGVDENSEMTIDCECDASKPDINKCKQKKECDYIWGCDGDSAVNLYCSNLELDKPLLENSISCDKNEYCKDGACEKKPYDCSDTARVREEIHDTLNELGVYDYDLEEECLESVVSEKLDNYDFKSRCMVVCGRVKINDNVNNLDAGSVKYIIGVNNAAVVAEKITSGLFGKLESVLISNIKLDYNLKLNKDNNQGMLARVSQSSVFDRVFVDSKKISYEENDENGIENVGGIVGYSKGDVFKNIVLNAVSIEINRPMNYIDCNTDMKKRHNNIGGIVGYTEDSNFIYNSVWGLNINSGYAANVGGMIGNGKKINVIGRNDDDIKNVGIINNERDVGSVVGHIAGDKESFSEDNPSYLSRINNLKVNIDNITASYACSGGIIGYVKNQVMMINNIDVSINSEISSGGYSGGIIGKITGEGTSVDVKNVNADINLVKSEQKCIDGDYSGGIIGSIEGGSQIRVTSINNVFKSIQANSFVGGLVGGIEGSGSIRIEDVINRNKTGNGIVAIGQYAGGLIGAAGNDRNKIDELVINNVVSEVTKVDANSYGAGFIGGIKFSYGNVLRSISNVISNSTVNSRQSSGFVSNIDLDNYNRFYVNNILTQASVYSKDETCSGFLYSVENWFYNKNNIRSRFDNILVNADVYVNDCYRSSSNVLYHESSGIECDSNDLKPDDWGNKDRIGNMFNNVLYATYGESKYLTYTADEYFDDNSKCARNWTADENLCVKYKDYKTPYGGCWFTNYSYWKDSVLIKPFIPFFVNICSDFKSEMCSGISYYKPNESNLNNSSKYYAEYANLLVNAKIHTENGDENNTTIWNQCDIIDSKEVIDSSIYSHLLCPLLKGKITCMGEWNPKTDECILSEKLTCIGIWDDTNKTCKTN